MYFFFSEGKTHVLCSRLNFVDLAGLDQQPSVTEHVGAEQCNTVGNNLLNTLNVSSVSSICLDVSTAGHVDLNSIDVNPFSQTDVLSNLIVHKRDEFSTLEFDHHQQQNEQIADNGDQCPEDKDQSELEGGDEAEQDEDDDALCGDNLEHSSCDVVVSADHQCLVAVIACLVDRNYTRPVPYSHSMLTQLLKESFGGNCLTLVVVCASPARKHLPATSLAMKYGGLARYIVNRPSINELPLVQDQFLWGFDNALQPPSEIPTSNSSVQTNEPYNTNSATASETATNTDGDVKNKIEAEEIFRLQFAGWQLQQLVEGADSLMRTSLPFLPATLQAQVGAWLCRRSETFHCLGQQQSQHWPHQHRDDRTLHVIEEVSEPGDLKNSRTSCDDTDDAGSSSSVSSLGEEFYEQLAVLTSQFTDCTRDLVQQVQVKVDTFSEQVTSTDLSSDDEALPIIPNSSSCDSAEEKMDSGRELCENGKKNTHSVYVEKKPILENNKIEELCIINRTNYINQTSPLLSNKNNVVLVCNALNDKLATFEHEKSISDDSDADMDTCDSGGSCYSDELIKDLIINEGVEYERSTSVNPTVVMHSSAASIGLVSAVAIHVHEANRRRQRELRETIREKESHLRTLQRGTREKEELLRQNQARLVDLQSLIEKETQLLNETRHLAKTLRGDRTAERDGSAKMQVHDRNLTQYRDRVKAINNFISIIKVTKTPPVDLATLSSRLQELRCELEEVETLVRVDDQRKQRLQDLRNNRPRKCDRQPTEEGVDDDNEDPLAGSSDPLSPLRGAVPSPPVRRDRVAVGGEEHIRLRRGKHQQRIAPVATTADLSQPHKRRLITSSSEQV